MAISKWLFLGHLLNGQTSLMRLNALRRCDMDAVGFDSRSLWNQQTWLLRQIITRTERGKFVNQLNEGLIRLAREVRPEYIWFDKQEYVRPQTMAELKKLGARLIYYTPDPYFTLSWKRTRLMDACLPMFDLLITSKTYELDRFSAVGPPHMYLPLGYCDEVHRPMPVADSQRVTLGFIGGWEPRRQAIFEAIKRRGVSTRICGYAWDHLIDGRWTPRRYFRLRRLAGGEAWQLQKSDALSQSITSGEVYGDEYASVLSSSDMSLGFLRKICPDQHTTRSFEIPACGSMLLADRTDEHEEFFTEGTEAEYFSSEEELIDKAIYYAERPQFRAKVAAAGYQRCISSGYSYVHRMQAVLAHLTKI